MHLVQDLRSGLWQLCRGVSWLVAYRIPTTVFFPPTFSYSFGTSGSSSRTCNQNELPTYISSAFVAAEDMMEALVPDGIQPLAPLRAALFVFALTGVGQWCTLRGRLNFLRVIDKYCTFFEVVLGYWSKESNKAYDVRKCCNEFCQVERSGEVKLISQFDREDDHVRERRNDISDTTSIIGSLVSIRAVLFMVIPELTFVTIFANNCASFPAYVSDKELSNEIPAIFIFNEEIRRAVPRMLSFLLQDSSNSTVDLETGFSKLNAAGRAAQFFSQRWFDHYAKKAALTKQSLLIGLEELFDEDKRSEDLHRVLSKHVDDLFHYPSISYSNFQEQRESLARRLKIYAPIQEVRKDIWLLHLQTASDAILCSRIVQFFVGFVNFTLTMLFFAVAYGVVPEEMQSNLISAALVILVFFSFANSISLVVIYGRKLGVEDEDWQLVFGLLQIFLSPIYEIFFRVPANRIEIWIQPSLPHFSDPFSGVPARFDRADSATFADLTPRRLMHRPLNHVFQHQPRQWFQGNLDKYKPNSTIPQADFIDFVSEALTGSPDAPGVREVVKSIVKEWCERYESDDSEISLDDFGFDDEGGRLAKGLWQRFMGSLTATIH